MRSMTPRLRTATALALGVVLALTVPPAPAHAVVRSAHATIGGHPVWAHFSNPDGGRDYTIHNELVRLVNAAPAGSAIRGAIHSLSIDSVANALLSAQNRGVDVRVVIDGKNESSTDPAVATVKKLTYHKFCQNSSGGRGCISTSPDGDMHTKMFTFTSTRDPNGVARSNVVWFGSANLTYSSGTDAFNNAVTVYGDATLAAGFNANFSDMWNRRHYTGDDYYDAGSGRGYYLAGSGDAYASPEGLDQTDTIVNRLNDVTPDAECRLRVGMASVTGGRPQLVAMVKRFRAAGCKVWMSIGTNGTGGISMSEAVYDELLAAGVAIRRKVKVHDKFFLLRGTQGGEVRYRVYSGSQNWTQDALNENDEIFVKMTSEGEASHPLYDAFYNHFNEMYNTGVTCTVANFPCA